jgi:hypothetical protein
MGYRRPRAAHEMASASRSSSPSRSTTMWLSIDVTAEKASTVRSTALIGSSGIAQWSGVEGSTASAPSPRLDTEGQGATMSERTPPPFDDAVRGMSDHVVASMQRQFDFGLAAFQSARSDDPEKAVDHARQACAELLRDWATSLRQLANIAYSLASEESFRPPPRQ